MSTSSNVPLGSIRLQSQQRADLENNPAVSTQEWNSYISNSYKRLYNMLISAYGNDYFISAYYSFSLTGAQFYSLPDGTPSFLDANGNQALKFWKLLRVDLQYSASPSGYVTLRRFEDIERNKFGFPNTAINWNGYSNLRYRITGNNLEFMPLPSGGQNARIMYVPAPANLQYMLSCSMSAVANQTTLGLVDTTGLQQGFNVAGTGIPTNTVISSVGSTSVVVSNSVTATLTSSILSFWSDQTTLDGIAGWDEFVIIDAAIKAQVKQENDITALAAQRGDLVDEIQALSEGRDAGQAFHVSDVLGANSGGWDGGLGSGGWGMDGGW